MSDVFSAISILLVFATVAFDIFIKRAQDFQNEPELDESATNQIQKKMDRKRKIIWELTFLFIGFSILFYIQLPTTIDILEKSTFSIWDFDESTTFWVIINTCSLLFIGLTARKLINMFSIKR